ncbi:hypothetical protein Pelo_13429 [Pelomyxa schiedti]|nr:hypothetical protein Pelo_13429 [Pelomyxa schiedti]
MQLQSLNEDYGRIKEELRLEKQRNEQLTLQLQELKKQPHAQPPQQQQPLQSKPPSSFHQQPVWDSVHRVRPMFLGSLSPVSEVEALYELTTKLLSKVTPAAEELEHLEATLGELQEQVARRTEDMQELQELREALSIKFRHSEEHIHQLLGTTLTTDSSETDIHEASERITCLIQKLLSRVPGTSVPSMPKEDRLLCRLKPTLHSKLTNLPQLPSLSSLIRCLDEINTLDVIECENLLSVYPEPMHKVFEEQFCASEFATLHASCEKMNEKYCQSYSLEMALQGKDSFLSLDDVHKKLAAMLPIAQKKLMLLSVKKQSSNLTPDMMCIVCSSNPRNVRFHPCGHGVLCSTCAQRVTHCPFCREMIQERQKLFL